MQNYLNSTTHNVAWFAKRHKDSELELKAPFQRNPVWAPKQRSYLIDSILRGFPIPELYMQEFTDAEGHDRYVVVDGQQRLRACLEFLEGRLTLDPDDSPDFADMSFNDLLDDQKKQVYNYNFVVRVLPDMPEPDLRAMFQRLNRNVVALNGQELRHATYWGEFISSVEKLASDERWSMCGIFTPNDIRRMLDVEFISEVVVALLHGLQNKKETLDDWYQAYEREYPQKNSIEAIVPIVLGELLGIMPELEKTRWRKKSDFYSLFVALAQHAGLMPFSRDARTEIRKRLLAFASQVDTFLGDPDTPDIPEGAKKYAIAVERAASDLANRRERETQILTLLKDILEAEQITRTGGQ
ncbi:MAG: DUF262 domain-containing protein [Thermodesulfovibrionales bacterium]